MGNLSSKEEKETPQEFQSESNGPRSPIGSDFPLDHIAFSPTHSLMKPGQRM